MTTLNRNGVTIYYEVHGAATERTPLMLTHGMSASSTMWLPNMEALSADRQVVAWDMRGHGSSESPDELAAYSESLSVGDIGAVLDASHIERAILGGFSLGGFLSLAFHSAHADRVAGLLLVDTGPGFKRDEPRNAWNEFVETTARELETRGLDALPDRPEVRAASHTSALGQALAARGIMKQYDARVIESLPSITVPALVVVGADDHQFLPAAEYMAAKIPGARKVVIADAGHAVNIDQPAAFNSAVAEFLEDL